MRGLLRRIFCETLGTRLEVGDSLQRIVSFSPAVTETLFLLGAADSIAGVSAFCARPDEARKKRVIGSYNTVGPGILRQLSPDLIFTVTGYQREFALRLSRELPVYAVELPVSVSGIIDMVVKVGLIINRIPETVVLARTLHDAFSSLRPVENKPQVYVEIDFNGPVTFGAYSYITDALRLLGAESIFGNEPREWLTPDLDLVRQKDPDVVIYEAKMFSRFSEQELHSMIAKRKWREMRAVRSNRVFLAPGPLDFLAHHGPSFITVAMPWLRKCLSYPS